MMVMTPTIAALKRAYKTVERLTDDQGRLKHIHTQREFDDALEIIMAYDEAAAGTVI